jgi:vitamin B12 transporter
MSSFFARVLLSCLVGLSAAGFLHSAFAAEGERSERSDVVETPEVFISSTKTEVPVKQVTSAVETITGEQMQQRKIKTVVEALRLAVLVRWRRCVCGAAHRNRRSS